MKTPHFRSLCLLQGLLAGSLILGFSAQAAVPITWNGADATWAAGTNWVGNTAPANDLTTNIAVFNSSTYTAQPNAGTTSVNGIEIGASSAALTLSGTALAIGSGGITTQTGAANSTISSPSALGANQIWTQNSGTKLTVNSLQGAFALTKEGSGTLQFDANFTTSGSFMTPGCSLIVNAGTVNANFNNNGATIGYSVVINSGGTVVTTATNGSWFTTNIRINSGGLMTCADNNSSQMQNVTLNGGTLSMGTATGGFGLSNGNWNFNNGVATAGNGNTSTISGSGYATLSQVGGTNFNVLTTDTLNVTAVLGHPTSGADTGLIKQGGGTMILAAASTYTSNTTVSVGTLLIDGSIASASAATVVSGAAVGGDGTVNGNLTLASGAKFVFDLNNTPLTVGGTFALDTSFGVGDLVTASLGSINWATVTDGTYKLIDTSFVFDATNISNFGSGNAYTFGGKQMYFTSGSNLLNVVVAVPEPATWALLALSLTTVVVLRRRRLS